MIVKSALRAICKAICNTCYVDDDVLRVMLLSNKDVDPESEIFDLTPDLVEIALTIVRGWVETSRSEGGVSVSSSTEQLNDNITFWCNKYGLEAENYLINVKVVENGSNMW